METPEDNEDERLRRAIREEIDARRMQLLRRWRNGSVQALYMVAALGGILVTLKTFSLL